ncbi:L-galactose dehydrogenase [Hibiscus trionum]|uniref:L-galactose dehydrogenase n=1 Tax=Hibiscus trionum TaxID=183268 RepID=A0A9W7GT07_HIBTR|nr:L-galactose dehydrogenase [Hibiscus trionum]
MNSFHVFITFLQSVCQAAAVYCKEKGKNISKLALQYSLSNKDISSVLVGMSSVKQVEENVATATELAVLGKDEETLAEVEAILKPVKNQTWQSGTQRS